MNFELLLERAKTGDKEAREEIFRMYRPLLIKNAMDKNVFDEDLYQELSGLSVLKTFGVDRLKALIEKVAVYDEDAIEIVWKVQNPFESEVSV